MHLPKPGGQPGTYAMVFWPAHLNSLRGISVNGNGQLLPGLGRVRRNIERLDGDSVAGVPCMTPFGSVGCILNAETHIPQTE